MPRLSKKKLTKAVEKLYRGWEMDMREELCEDLTGSESLAEHMSNYPEPIALNIGSWNGVLERTLYKRFPEQFEKGFILGIDPMLKGGRGDRRLWEFGRLLSDARIPGWLNIKNIKNDWKNLQIHHVPGKNILRVGSESMYHSKLSEFQGLPLLCKKSFLEKRKFDVTFSSWNLIYINYRELIRGMKPYTKSFAITDYKKNFVKQAADAPKNHYRLLPTRRSVISELRKNGFTVSKSGAREAFWYIFARRA